MSSKSNTSKLTFLITSFTSGGAEKVLSVIIQELDASNIDIEVICLENDFFYSLPDRIKVTVLSKDNKQTSPIMKFIHLFTLSYKLTRYIKRHSIELIQSHIHRANCVNLICRLFGAKHKIQIVNTGAVSPYSNQGLQGKLNLFFIRHLYPLADVIINKSVGMQNDLNVFLPNIKKNSVVIHNPYKISEISLMSSEKPQNFRFKKDITYLCNIGRFETFKRQDLIIQALTQLSPSIELILIGDGINMSKFKLLSKQLGVDKRVHFIGRVQNPYAYISKSSIYILSSDDGEGFPNALVEAMICGIPVIATDCASGPREILAPQSDPSFQLKDSIEVAQNGILIPKNDVTILQQAINTLISVPELTEKLVRSAKATSNKYSCSQIVEQYRHILVNSEHNHYVPMTAETSNYSD